MSRAVSPAERLKLQGLTMAPSFRGALVVCPGGGNAQVRLELIQAVAALTGLDSNSISVCRGNTGN